MKKYFVQQGWVRSRTDGQRHFIGADRLIRLYGVDPRECEINERPVVGHPKPGQIVLRPRYDGNYSLPEPGDVS